MRARSLVVMRHAHAADGAWPDHDRPLTDRGWAEARAQGRRVSELGWAVGHLLCSDATRTTQTLGGVQDGLGRLVQSTVLEALYLPPVRVMLEQLGGAPDVDALWILSHNPSCEELVRGLSGVVVALPPATLVRLTGAGATWASALDGAWSLDAVCRP